MKETKIASRIVNQSYARVYAATAFSFAVSENDGQLVFGLLDTEDPETLRAEGRLLLSITAARALHGLLGRSLEQLEAQLKAGRTVQ